MRYHIVDPHCSVAGGEDFGAVDTREEAEKIVADRIASGDEGGCRCQRGYLIQTCEERLRNNLGWTERQEQDMRMYVTGFLNLNPYRPRDGVTRELTPEESASHKCYNYQPRRFSEILHGAYRKMYKKAEIETPKTDN
jgi:hypothetical protein